MKRGFTPNGQVSLELAIVLTIAVVSIGTVLTLADDSAKSNQTISIQNQGRQIAFQTSQKLSAISTIQNFSSASLIITTQKIRAMDTHFNEICTVAIQKFPSPAVTVTFDLDGTAGTAETVTSTVLFAVPDGVINRITVLNSPPNSFSFSCGQTITLSWTALSGPVSISVS